MGTHHRRVDRIEHLEPRRLLATIEGTVYNDLDGDGLIEPGEPPRAGIEIYLDQNANDVRDTGEAFTTTDVNGHYAFTVSPGTYRVNQAKTADDLRTYPGTGRTLISLAGAPTNATEYNPLTNTRLADLSPVSLGSNGAIAGDSAYVPVRFSITAGSPIHTGILRSSTTSGDYLQILDTPLDETISYSAILGNELFLRRDNSNVVFVLNRETGNLNRTITLPAGTLAPMAAMSDRGALLIATSTSLLRIDPQDGSVLQTTPTTAITSSGFSFGRMVYLSGSVFVGTSSGGTFRMLNPSTGTWSNMPGQSGYPLLDASTPSDLVEAVDATPTVVNFARSTYTPATLPPIIVSYSRTGGGDEVDRVSVADTIPGATLTFVSGLAALKDAQTYRVNAPVNASQTTVEIAWHELTPYNTRPIIAAWQTLPGHLPQRFRTGVMFGPTQVSASLTPTAGASPGFTNDTRPTIRLTQVSSQYAGTNPTVAVFDGEEPIGTVQLSGTSGSIRPATSLAEGTHRFAVSAYAPLIIPGPLYTYQSTDYLTITVDTTAPTLATIYDVDAANFLLHGSEAILGSISASNLRLEQLDANDNVIATLAVSVGAMSGSDARVTPTAGRLADGRYRLTVLSAGTLRDRAANALVVPPPYTFTVLAGDANSDGTVNFDDLLILAQNYGASGKTFSQGNFDYSADGVVGFDDLLILAQHYRGAPDLNVVPVAATKKKTSRR